IDDGSGMSREDALLSVRRHATSKLRTADDLLAIRTLGFRGEALAAIGSVSRLVVRTALHGASEGTEVRVEDGEARALPAAARPGTQVRVEDLFGAVPARRKFLRRAETEEARRGRGAPARARPSRGLVPAGARGPDGAPAPGQPRGFPGAH